MTYNLWDQWTIRLGVCVSMPIEIAVVFEGGGAKGIAHVAAMRALEELNSEDEKARFAPRMFAGTSIGAAIAACFATGARSEQILNRRGEFPYAEFLGLSHLKEALGVSGLRRLTFIRYLFNFEAKFKILVLAALGLVIASYQATAFVLAWPTRSAVDLLFLIVAYYLISALLRATLVGLSKRYKREQRIDTLLQIYAWYPIIAFGLGLFLTVTVDFLTGGWDGPMATVRHVLRGWFELVLYFLLLAALTTSAFRAIRRVVRGLIGTGPLREELNRLLALLIVSDGVDDSGEPRYRSGKSRQDYYAFVEHGVKFKDLPNLFVVAADVVGGAVRVFGGQGDADIAVADAVVASMAVPLLFQPKLIGDRLYVDGGIVSNIPAWVFRNTRALRADLHVVAFSIGSDTAEVRHVVEFMRRREEAGQSKWLLVRRARRLLLHVRYLRTSIMYPFTILRHIAFTAVFGGRPMELEATGRLTEILLWPEFALLDFSKSAAEARAELERLTRNCKLRLRLEFIDGPLAFITVCEQTLGMLGLPNATTAPNRIRIFLAEQQPRAEALSIRKVWGFDHKIDLDDRILLPRASSLAGFAAASGRPLFADTACAKLLFDGHENRYRHALKWKELNWCWCIPFYAPHNDTGIADGVLAIEGSAPIVNYGAELGAACHDQGQWLLERLLRGTHPGEFERLEEDSIFTTRSRLVAQLLSERMFAAELKPIQEGAE